MSRDIDLQLDTETLLPCNLLLIAPRNDLPQNDPAAQSIDSLKEAFKALWPSNEEPPPYLRIASSRQQLNDALAGQQPHLVYIYAHGVIASGQPCLQLDDQNSVELLPMTELASQLKQQRPAPGVIYFNITGLTGEGLDLLANVAPLVIGRRLANRRPESTALSLAWLQKWFQDEEDPLTALHSIDGALKQTEWLSLLVYSQYRSWKVQTFQTRLRHRSARLALDRAHQKALVGKDLTELADSDLRRVMALVAYGDPGNLLNDLHQQLKHYLESVAIFKAEINWLKLQFPVVRSDTLQRDLESELDQQLERGFDEPVTQLLRRHAPRIRDGRKRSTLWLNWGVFGHHKDEQPPLSPTQLQAWLRFCSEYLNYHCPDDLRIVAYLVIDTEQNKYPGLEQALQANRREPWSRHPGFRLSVLPPLSRVVEADLSDFLEEPANSNCPPAIQAEIAERLIIKTGGEFESTVMLMAQAEPLGWYDLLRQLQHEQGVKQAQDDQPF